MLSKLQLYGVLAALTAGGYAWLGLHLLGERTSYLSGLCLFKNVAGIPCPSCGTTRAVLCLLHGQWQDALYINPLGIVAFLLLIVIPILIGNDLLFQKKQHTFSLYQWMEFQLKNNKSISIPALSLVLLNWAWSIVKHL